MYVSHETIYRTLFIQARGALNKELVAQLRSHRTMRHARNWSKRGKGKGQIRDAVSIRERPAEVEDRAVPGHWEGDLLMGTATTQIATLVERSSRFTILVKIPKGKLIDGYSQVQLNAVARQLNRRPRQTLNFATPAETLNSALTR